MGEAVAVGSFAACEGAKDAEGDVGVETGGGVETNGGSGGILVGAEIGLKVGAKVEGSVSSFFVKPKTAKPIPIPAPIPINNRRMAIKMQPNLRLFVVSLS